MLRTQTERPVGRSRSSRRSRRWISGTAVVIAAVLSIRTTLAPQPASAKTPPAVRRTSATTAASEPQSGSSGAAKLQVVAVVNGDQFTREELARECLRHYGTEVLESLVNKRLISDQCAKHGVTVSGQEIGEEIDRMARKFGLPKDKWLKMLEKERGVKPSQYAQDIIWPTIALRKLASAQLQITRAELDQAYDSQFGPAVKARLIVVSNRRQADSIRAQAAARPEEFGVLAKKHSEDVNSASSNGMIQPIRRHVGDPQVERVAFGLRPGEVSPVLAIGNQFAILKCEGHLEATRPNRQQVEPLLEEVLRDRKLRAAATIVFRDLQKNAKVKNVFNDPVLSRQLPGVAAQVNGQNILMHELAEECIDRHGVEVLEGSLNRRVIEQALRKRKLTVTQADVDAEVARAAASMGQTTREGRPDVNAWLKLVTREQGITTDVYLRDSVWPSAALKKLIGDNVKIDERDLQKGFEANYGPRMRCKAIVLNNQRKAQEVWEKARRNPTPKFFGDLAEQYSIEANSRSLRGDVPPIRKHGGQPILEREAFNLQPGELSGVIQVGENFIILLCEGRTESMHVRLEEVRPLLYEDLHEKKLRIAMAKYFDELQNASHVDNFLAGTLKAPHKPQRNARDSRVPDTNADVDDDLSKDP